MLTSIVRTLAANLVGALVGLALSLGIAVPADMSEGLTLALAAALALAAQFVYYVVARWAERQWPWVGQLMLWSKRQPVYGPASAAPAMRAAATLPPSGYRDR